MGSFNQTYVYDDSGYIYLFFYNSSDPMVGQLNYKCRGFGSSLVWMVIKIAIVATGLPVNIALLWMLIDGWKAQLASQMLSLNLCFMAVLYCLLLPLDICTGFIEFSDSVVSLSEAFSILNLLGCPLLASAMCMERYIAVSWPVVYLELRKSQYRLIFSILVWALTLAVAIIVYIWNLQAIGWLVSLNISVLYVLMLMCLGGIIFILCKKGPGDNERDTPRKRKALHNVLAVLCPFTIAYLPILTFVPLQSSNFYKNQTAATSCSVFQTIISFPNFGVYIGPVFYLSRFKQFLSWSSKSGVSQTNMQAVESRSSFTMNKNAVTGAQPAYNCYKS